jgi:serine/threonine protein kinase
MTGPPDPSEAPAPDPPERVAFPFVPDHQLLRLIGSGASGQVWLARDIQGVYRAVKIVYEKTFRHRRPFEREFSGVQRITPISRLHDGLLDIVQVGRDDPAGYFYCVMELADDAFGREIAPEQYIPRTLAHELASRKRLPVEECVRIGIGIASALSFLHKGGLIHRDIKPSNIIFLNGTPRLADIGLVADVADARSYVGTEGFIPPEGPGTVQADIYSLGKVLYEISTGKDRNDYPELPAHLDDPAEERELLRFNKIILKACRASLSERYRTADELLTDLNAFLQGEPPPPPLDTGRIVRIAATVAGVAIGIGIVFALVWRLIWLLKH